MSTHFYFVQLAQVERHFSVRPAQDSNWKNDISQLRNGLFHSVQAPIRDMEWKPCEPSKIKRTHRSRSFWLPRRRSQASLAFTRSQASLAFTRCGHHSLLPRMLMTFRRCCIAAAMDSTALSYCRMVGIDWPARAPSLLRSRSAR